jgi:beta-glucosidase
MRFNSLLSLLCLPLLAAPAVAQISSNIDQRVETMLGKLSLEQKIDLIGGVDHMFIREMPNIGLPRLKMSDGPMGVRTWGPTTGYAAGIGLAASWDTDLAKRVGVSLGHDARSRGVSFLLGPGVNIYRIPMNGRNFEYFGEDPWLAGRIAVAYIQGVQSQGVIATVKHYVANNSELDRHNTNSVVDERTLREIYLPVFEAAVKEGHVGAVMDSYNLINGQHATENGFLNNQVLKKEWGFRGILMSDWNATYDGVKAANGGLDLEMPSGRFMNRETLIPAVESGKVSVATIDDKVRRILRTALEFGLADRDQTDYTIPRYSQESRQVALESAQESMVLLKNEGNLLPLDKGRIHTIAVIGPHAWPAEVTGGGSANVTAFAPVSFLTGLSDSLEGHAKVTYSRGVRELRDVFDSEVHFSTDAAGAKPGLKEEHFANGKLEGTPARVATAPRVYHWPVNQWGPVQPDRIALRWSGYYIPQKSGLQKFIVAAAGRDAYKLYVDGKLAIDQPSREGQSPNEYDLEAAAGKPVAVRLDYLAHSNRPTICFTALLASDLVEPEAAKLASMADVAVVSVGFDPSTESEGHDRTWTLPTGQDDLIKAVEAANPRTIVVLTAGGGVDTNQWLDRTPALLQTWYGGQEAGRALKQVLFGEVNPSGKLPITFERHIEDNPAYKHYYPQPGTLDVKYDEGVFVGYRYYDHTPVKPLFPFGYGLSYTTFAFSDLKVAPAESDKPDVTVSFDIKNTGDRQGADVAQVYVGDPTAKVRRPFEELKGFERVELKPGETKHISITLNRRSFAYWDASKHDWTVDPGRFVIWAGDSSVNLPLEGQFTFE